MTDFNGVKAGDKVRVVLETVVGDVDEEFLETEDNIFRSEQADLVSVEVLEPAEPKFKAGDFLKDVADNKATPDLYLLLDDGSHVYVNDGVRCCESTNFDFFEHYEVEL